MKIGTESKLEERVKILEEQVKKLIDEFIRAEEYIESLKRIIYIFTQTKD